MPPDAPNRELATMTDRELLLLTAERVRTLSEKVGPICEAFPTYKERVDTHLENHKANNVVLLSIAAIIATIIAAIIPRFLK